MFVAVLCCIFWRLVLNLSHSIIHTCARMIWILTTLSDSATVSESISSSSTINLSVCSVNKTGWLINKSLRSYFHHIIRLPLLRRASFINIPFWVAWWVCFFKSRWRSWLVSRQTTSFTVVSNISTCALRGLWLSCLVFPGLSDAVDDRADGGLSMLRAI